MERHYTQRVVMDALQGATYKPTLPKMTEDRQSGIMTCRRFTSDGRTRDGLTAQDVQKWMARKGEFLPDWILKNVLEHTAREVIDSGGRSSKHQISMDEEAKNAD